MRRWEAQRTQLNFQGVQDWKLREKTEIILLVCILSKFAMESLNEWMYKPIMSFLDSLFWLSPNYYFTWCFTSLTLMFLPSLTFKNWLLKLETALSASNKSLVCPVLGLFSSSRFIFMVFRHLEFHNKIHSIYCQWFISLLLAETFAFQGAQWKSV